MRHAHGLSSHRRACSHGRNQKTFPNHPTFPVRIKFPYHLSSRPVRPVNAPLRKHRTPFLRSRPPRRRPRCSALGALLSPRASPGRYPLPMPLFSCRPRFGHLKRAKARWIPKGACRSAHAGLRNHSLQRTIFCKTCTLQRAFF